LLHSGVAIAKAFHLAGKKSTDAKGRTALSEAALAIRGGSDVASALNDQKCFPDLMIDMISVAEQTGSLPEVLAHLANHYENSVNLKRSFISQITWPTLQLVAAIFVIALLIVVLSMVGESGNNQMSFLVFGLSGVEGAGIWLMSTFGSSFLMYLSFKVISASVPAKQLMDPILMKIPVLGHCMRSFAIARFSWAYYLTQQSGMPIKDSLDASFRATANGAFIGASDSICVNIMEGEDLTTALAGSRLFPDDFVEMVSVAETSGTVPEALYRLSPQFEDQAQRSLKALTRAMAVLVWLVVAGFIVFFIIRFVRWYVNMISDAANGLF